MMEPVNFFYWLQGYFELAVTGQAQDSTISLTPAQAECVRRHLALVEAVHARRREPLPENIVKLRTIVDMLLLREDLALFCADQIRRIVHDVFEHVIDPQAGGPEVQAELNEIHCPPPKPATAPPKPHAPTADYYYLTYESMIRC